MARYRCSSLVLTAAFAAAAFAAPARASQEPIPPQAPAAPVLPAPGLAPVAPGPTAQPGRGSAAPSPYASPFATPEAPRGVPGALLSIPADYRLDIGDLVEIKVLFRLLKGTNLDATVPVPSDGLLRLSRLKAPVNARGLTCDDLAKALRQGWSHQFRLQPGQVVVRVANPRLRKINLMGNGIENGVVGLQPGWRIADVIVATGGNPYPERAKLVVTNRQRPTPVTVDLVEALANPESSANIALLEGDVVTVTVPKAERLIVYGEGPRGTHNIDERYGLRLALAGLGYSTTNATGSLREAMIVRKAVEGDPTSKDEVIPVNLHEVMKPTSPDVELRDMDMLYIPPSERQVYVFGAIGGPRLVNLREDKATYLLDLMAMLGGPITGHSSIGNIGIMRMENGKQVVRTYDFGRFLKRQDPNGNPEILPKDVIYVPPVERRTERGIGQFFQTFSVYGAFKGIFGSLFGLKG